ncbi:MAG: hypothetical protein U0414_33155 [Polyangiaceae bacterium]
MSGGLIPVDGGGAPARCLVCGGAAVGPCARCREPVCGDCCVLTEGGATVWAICVRCDARGGRSLSRGWLTVVGWVVAPTIGVALLLILLALLTGRWRP